MNLPHEKPIRFVNKVIKNEENKFFVSCTFPYPPTLAMTCEAAAQSTAAYAKEDETTKIAYLVSLKNVVLEKEIDFTEAVIEIEKTFEFGTMSEYKFKLKSENELYVVGNITIAMQNN